MSCTVTKDSSMEIVFLLYIHKWMSDSWSASTALTEETIGLCISGHFFPVPPGRRELRSSSFERRVINGRIISWKEREKQTNEYHFDPVPKIMFHVQTYL